MFILASIAWTPEHRELLIPQAIGGNFHVQIKEIPDIHHVEYNYTATYIDEDGVQQFEWSEPMGIKGCIDSSTQIIETNNRYILPYQTRESACAFIVNKKTNSNFTFVFNNDKLWADSLLFQSDLFAPNYKNKSKSEMLIENTSSITVGYRYTDAVGSPVYLKIQYRFDEYDSTFRSVRLN